MSLSPYDLHKLDSPYNGDGPAVRKSEREQEVVELLRKTFRNFPSDIAEFTPTATGLSVELAIDPTNDDTTILQFLAIDLRGVADHLEREVKTREAKEAAAEAVSVYGHSFLPLLSEAAVEIENHCGQDNIVAQRVRAAMRKVSA